MFAYYIIQRSFNFVRTGAKYEWDLNKQRMRKAEIDKRLINFEPISKSFEMELPPTIAEKYFKSISDIEDKNEIINLTLDRFEKFTSAFIFEFALKEMFPTFNKKHIKKMEQYFYEGLYEMQKYGYIASVGYSKKRKVFFVGKKKIVYGKVATRGFKLTDEFIRQLFAVFFTKERRKEKVIVNNCWLSQCSQIKGISAVLVLKLFSMMVFLMSKRKKCFNYKITWLSYKNLSNMTGLTQNGVLNYVNLLRNNGILYSKTQWNNQEKKSYKNMYSVPEHKDYVDLKFEEHKERMERKILSKQIQESEGEFGDE